MNIDTFLPRFELKNCDLNSKIMLNKHVLKNGMVILGEPIEGVESVAFGFLLPCGSALLPSGHCGAANIIEDWIFRGADDLDNRALNDALDSLGINRSSSVGTNHISIAAALQAENLLPAIELYAKIITKPRLKDQQFIPAKQLALDGIAALEDDPRTKVMLNLYENFYPAPLGTSTTGKAKDINDLTEDKVRALIDEHFNYSKSIFAIAGNYDFDKLCKKMEALFDIECNQKSNELQLAQPGQKYTHFDNEGSQVHIGLMTPTAKPDDKDYYNIRTAVAVLSGGMSARLFTEVREKRGLCYAIGARYHGLKQAAGIACYAGTAAETAQQTYDVTREQFEKLHENITQEEIDRAKAGLKSQLIMSSESTAARTAGIAADYYLLSRVRSLDEIKEKIEQTSVDSVTEYLKNNKFNDYTVVTIGSTKVEM